MSGFKWTSGVRDNTLRRRRQEAEDESAGAAHQYTRQRPYLETGSETVIERARLDYVYRADYSLLSDLFSEAEMASLVACFQGEIFTPQRIQHIASYFLSCACISGRILNSGEDLVYEKLSRLSPTQRLTLADTLEQLWFRGPEVGGAVGLLTELGIKLRK